jgi:hypothetical protein
VRLPAWERVASALVTVLIWLVATAVGFAAYVVSGLYHGSAPSLPATSAEVDNLQSLIQLTIAGVTAIGSYTVLREITASSLSRQLKALKAEIPELRSKLDVLDGRLTDLRETKIFYDKDDGLAEAQRLQQLAQESIETMWTLVDYDWSLKDYFAKTLALPNRYTVRIVAAKTVSREDLLDHIEASWQYLAGAKPSYELHIIRECNYEATIADHGQAAGLFFYDKRGFGSFFISSGRRSGDGQSGEGRFAKVMEGLFEAHLASDEVKQLPIEKGAPLDDAKIEALSKWLSDNFYDSMP